MSDNRFTVEVINDPLPESVVDKVLTESNSDSIRLKAYELAAITFNCKGFPHNVPMQLRTHRRQITFDVSSQRYTEERVKDVARGYLEPSDVFYWRDSPLVDAKIAEKHIIKSCELFYDLTSNGYPAEAARDFLPQGIRQNFVFTCTLRTLMHILDLRYKPDAQAEIQTLSHMLIESAREYYPKAIQWYISTRALKGVLAP